MKKVSIIIPVYNSEKFIRQCIGSVQEQTYENLDIVIIDDGSVDYSVQICREEAQRDARIRILCQENSGVSAARNKGIDEAQGEYIFFLDSDDAIHPLLIEESVMQVEKWQAQAALFRFQGVTTKELEEKMKSISGQDERPDWELAEGKKLADWFHAEKSYSLSRISVLVSREFVGQLRFDESLPYGEDTMFMYGLLCKGVRMVYSNQAWYYYRTNPDSASHQYFAAQRREYFRYAEIIRDSELESGRRAYALLWEGMYLYQIKRALLAMEELKNKKGIRELKRQASRELHRQLFWELPLRKRAVFQCCLISVPLYALGRKCRRFIKRMLCT